MASIARIAARRELDALVLSMRDAGASFQAIADAMGIASRDGARQLHARALARSVRRGERATANERPVDPYFAAWAAGFFDGEGCVSSGTATDRKGRHRARFQVIVSQAVEAPLAELCDRYGGTVRLVPARNPVHKDQWRWQITGLAAADFLRDILPYLRVKREVTELGLQLLALIHRQGWRVTDDEHAERLLLARAIKARNERGRQEKAAV
jgi:hypothetical protein